VRAPETLTTARLLLRRATAADATDIFARYAGDPEVTRYLGWSRHRTIDDTHAFVRWSDQVWSSAPAGPYLIFERERGRLCGSTGLDIETPYRAATGYVLACDAWGRGLATEATLAMAELADAIGVARLYALCHAKHAASGRVLHKAGFAREGVLRRHTVFPNLDADGPQDVECWARVIG
jgi:ribosomal-protein-alanine N-acetyltransferase